MHRKYTQLLALFLFAFLLCCCKKKKNEIPLTEITAMEKFVDLSPEQGAYFYAENRQKYNFLDELYMDSVFPALLDCNFFDLRGVYLLLKNTPIEEEIYPFYIESKTNFLSMLFNEITENNQLYKEVFITDVFPLIEMELDSMINSDISEVINDYSGGFLNWKKLKFFTGNDSRKFREFWNARIDSQKYQNAILNHIESYSQLVNENQNKFYSDVTGGSFDRSQIIDYPSLSIELSDSIVKQVELFTSGEKNAIIKGTLRDWVAPVVIGMATGGLGAFVYEAGVLSYDIKVTIDDIEDQKMEPEDILLFLCTYDLNHKILDNYMPSCVQQLFDTIDSNDAALYNMIALRYD